MKKIILLFLLILTGCQSSKSSDEIKLDQYISLYNAAFNNVDYQTSSQNFSLSVEFASSNDQYIYNVILDEPQVAMYDVQLVVLEDISNYNLEDMMPSIGIFDDIKYNLLPYQSNPESNYYKGIMVSGDVKDANTKLYVLVNWKDVTRTKEYREFIILSQDNVESEQ